MAKTYGINANLQLSVYDAVRNLAKVQKELKALKSDFDKPLSVKVVIDTSELNKAANQVKQALNQVSGGTSAKTKVADLSQISKQLDNISRLLTKILGSTSHLNTQMHGLRANIKDAFAQQKEMKEANKVITNITNNIGEQRKELRDLGQEYLNLAATTTRAIGQATEGLENMLGSYRNFGQNLLTNFASFAGNVLNTVGFGVSNMIDEAIEQEKKLQQSQIGFTNMFPGQDASAMIQQVRTTAAKSPGLNSGDLADYINQLGAVSGGSFSTAFNATMGILKTVQYGGGDAASQMGYIIKNIRDVMAKGKATQIDVQQFNRAMPLLQKSLAAIGASEFLKDGELKITKENAANLMQAFARLNTEDNPAYNIFDQTAKTLGGLQEEFRETVSTQIATMLEGLGFFDALSEIMRGSVFTEIDQALEGFAKWVKEIKDAIDWGQVGEAAVEVLNDIKTVIGEFGRMVKENFGNTETIKLVINTIGSFFEGLIKGATEVGKVIAAIKDKMGEEGFTNLAKSLGQAVTQGFLLQKVLGVVAEGFSGLGTILQTIAFGRFLTQGLRQGQGLTMFPGMATPSIAGTSGLSNKFGFFASGLTGGRLSPLAASKASSSIASFFGKAAGRLGIGSAIGLLGDGLAEVTAKLNIFGDKTTDVANAIDIGGNAIQYAIYGSIVGPFGAAAGAALGLATGLYEAEKRTKEMAAAEAESKVLAQKTAEQERVVQATIATFLSDPNNVFDERTEAAQWVKTQLYEYLQNTPTAEWDSAKIYDRFVSAYRQKLGHEAMVEADNIGGFWDLQGSAVEFVTKKNGQPMLTDYGERLANLIRTYNLVGYDSYEKLMQAADETLVNQYLQNETLNRAQIEFLENQAAKFEQEVGMQITESRDKINKAIEEAGTITDAINLAKAAGDELWQTQLEAYQYLTKLTKDAVQDLANYNRTSKVWTEEVAKELLGDEAGALYGSWKDKNDFWGWFTSGDRGRISSLFGTDDIQEIVKRIFEAAQTAEVDMNNQALSEAERSNAQSIYEAYKQFLTDFKDQKIEGGNWEQIRSALDAVVRASIAAGSTDILDNRLRYGFFGDKWTLQDWIDWLKVTYGGEYFAGGGRVKPVFRAGGGLGVDTVPAFLQPGEFVQKASAVSTAGLGVMNALNNGDLASAYRLIGSKISGHWNNSRNISNTSDNRASTVNNTYVFNRNAGGRAGFYNSLANRVALGR